MALQELVYQMFSKLLGWIVLRTRSDITKEIEILVLRHRLAVLQRCAPRPRMTWTDRALMAVLARLLPASPPIGLLVAPATILRWHRVGAENRVMASGLAVTARRPTSMLARRGPSTRIPAAHSRAELAGAARQLRRSQGRRDPGARVEPHSLRYSSVACPTS